MGITGSLPRQPLASGSSDCALLHTTNSPTLWSGELDDRVSLALSDCQPTSFSSHHQLPPLMFGIRLLNAGREGCTDTGARKCGGMAPRYALMMEDDDDLFAPSNERSHYVGKALSLPLSVKSKSRAERERVRSRVRTLETRWFTVPNISSYSTILARCGNRVRARVKCVG